MGKVKPFEEKKAYRLEMLNEWTSLFLLYHVLCLNKNWVQDEMIRELVGYSFMISMTATMFCHLGLLFKFILFDLVLKFKKWRFKRFMKTYKPPKVANIKPNQIID